MNTLLLAIVAILLCTGQFLFKRTGLAIRGYAGLDAVPAMLSLPSFYFALILYGLATVMWIYVLSRVPLLQAYPWIAAASAATPLIGWLAFNERAGAMFWIGLTLVVVGLLLTQLGSESTALHRPTNPELILPSEK